MPRGPHSGAKAPISLLTATSAQLRDLNGRPPRPGDKIPERVRQFEPRPLFVLEQVPSVLAQSSEIQARVRSWTVKTSQTIVGEEDLDDTV